MADLKSDMIKLQELIQGAYNSSGSLMAMADGGMMDRRNLQQSLEKTMDHFERAVIELRRICEVHSPGVGSYGKKPVVPAREVTGYVETIEGAWLHICLNTLLPHCRFQTPVWLSDTIRRLLDDYEAQGFSLPFYKERALLIIDEHSSIGNRNVFDQDNKGWKGISNVLKGRVIKDDDQHSLGIVLLSTPSNENVCHISLLSLRDASDFFSLHSGSYTRGCIYRVEQSGRW